MLNKIIAQAKKLSESRVMGRSKYKLYEIMVITILAILCGCDGWKSFSLFAGTNFEVIRLVLPDLKGVPSADTFARVLSRVNLEELYEFFCVLSEALFKRDLERSRGRPKAPEVKDHIAIDGKTIRGAKDRETGKSLVHIVNAVLNDMTLAAMGVNEKSNEIKAIPPLLELLEKYGLLEGKVVSTDALGSQKSIAKQVKDSGADYVFTIKENHPILYGQLEDFFSTWHPENPDLFRVEEASTGPDIVSGRIETRSIVMVHLDEEACKWMTKVVEWEGIQAAAKVTRIFEPANPDKSGDVTIDSRIIITSLNVPPQTLLGHAVKHWGVEVLHNRLDCSLDEDRCRVWKGSGPEVLSLIRKLVLNIIVPVTKRNDKVSVNDINQICRNDWGYLRSMVDNKPGQVVTPKVAIKRRVEAIIASSKPIRRV